MYEETSLLNWLTDLEEPKKQIIYHILGISEVEVVLDGKAVKIPVTVNTPLLTKDEFDKICPLIDSITSRITLFSNMDAELVKNQVKSTLMNLYEQLIFIELERNSSKKMLTIYIKKADYGMNLDDVLEKREVPAPQLLEIDIESIYNIFENIIFSVISRCINGMELERWKSRSSFGGGFDLGGGSSTSFRKGNEEKEENLLDW